LDALFAPAIIPGVRLVVSDPAADLIEERGGRVYVWLKRGRCCGGVTRLVSASAPPEAREFQRVDADQRFEVYLPVGLARLPDELHIDVRRFPRRLEAYWNNCAWVV
jgi:hypothetical protein